MTHQFIGEQIEVESTGDIKQPVSFHWRENDFTIDEILLSWFDWGFAGGATQRDWRNRRHRTYYRVRTNTDEIFEIYLDRRTKSGQAEWYLYQRLDSCNE